MLQLVPLWFVVATSAAALLPGPASPPGEAAVASAGGAEPEALIESEASKCRALKDELPRLQALHAALQQQHNAALQALQASEMAAAVEAAQAATLVAELKAALATMAQQLDLSTREAKKLALKLRQEQSLDASLATTAQKMGQQAEATTNKHNTAMDIHDKVTEALFTDTNKVIQEMLAVVDAYEDVNDTDANGTEEQYEILDENNDLKQEMIEPVDSQDNATKKDDEDLVAEIPCVPAQGVTQKRKPFSWLLYLHAAVFLALGGGKRYSRLKH